MLTRIYFTCVSPLADERLYRSLYTAASEARRQKTDRYRFPKDRMLSLGAEGLLLYALQKAGRGREAISYRYGAHQKPYLADADGFFFNLSHAGEYAMLAVSDAEVGCDVERIRPVDRKLFTRVLTADERSVLAAAPEAERDALFFAAGRELYEGARKGAPSGSRIVFDHARPCDPRKRRRHSRAARFCRRRAAGLPLRGLPRGRRHSDTNGDRSDRRNHRRYLT